MRLRRFGHLPSIKREICTSALTSSIIASLWVAGTANAQDTQADATEPSDTGMIVVTAQRRQELSRDVPITLTTANAIELQEANVDSLLSLPKLVPGVRIDQQGSYTQPTIRGIGTILVQTAGGSSVGTYVDGFYLPNPLSLDFDFLNVENVQVLKGPQGTLFGRNTTGGAILVTTKDPSTDTGGVVEASYRRFDQKKLQGYFTTGLADNIAFSVEGLFSKGDGFIQRNLYDGSLDSGSGFDPNSRIQHPGAYEKWSVRAGLKVDLSDSASLLLRYTHMDRDDPRGNAVGTYAVNGQVYSAGDLFPNAVFATRRGTVSGNSEGSFRIKTDAVQLTGNFDLGFADLTSYTQYREESIKQVLEGDYSSFEYFSLGLPEHDEIMSQELVLNSKSGARLQYTAGIFLFQHKVDAVVDLRFPIAFGTSDFVSFSETGATVRTYAAFADATYELTDKLFLTGGLRLSRDQTKDVRYQTTPGVVGQFTYQSDRQDDKLTPRVVLRYKPTDESSLYASFTKGYKSAVPDYRSTSGAEYLEPENITAYEAGAKFADGRLTAEFAGFLYDYKNLQNGYYITGETILSNAASARIKGLEGSLRYDFGNGFEISASGTYLDAKYRDYPTAGLFTPVFVPDTDGDGRPDFSGFANSTAQARGNQMQRAPEFSGTFAARYSTELAGGELVTSANLYHTSKFYFDAANDFGQGGYTILSARVQWTDPSQRYTVAVFGDNLTDETYLTQLSIGNSAVGTIWGEPATYGISLRVNFGAQ